MGEDRVEPWLRGTHMELDPLRRAVLHALEQAREDVARWCVPLDVTVRASRPHGLPSVDFQLRHIARSLDRLLTYAEGRRLTAAQLDLLVTEATDTADAALEFHEGLDHAMMRLLQFAPDAMNEMRGVGRAGLPTTVGGLLIHIAEHTQRHVGQAITTAKVTAALAEAEAS